MRNDVGRMEELPQLIVPDGSTNYKLYQKGTFKERVWKMKNVKLLGFKPMKRSKLWEKIGTSTYKPWNWWLLLIIVVKRAPLKIKVRLILWLAGCRYRLHKWWKAWTSAEDVFVHTLTCPQHTITLYTQTSKASLQEQTDSNSQIHLYANSV